MSEPAKRHRAVEEFLARVVEQPEGQQYELMNGEVVGMASECLAHAQAKGLLYRRLFEAARDASLPCEAFRDRVVLRVDTHTIYEPSAMLRCGPLLPGDTVMVKDPVIAVEVFSPLTGGVDVGIELADYFLIPSTITPSCIPATVRSSTTPAARRTRSRSASSATACSASTRPASCWKTFSRRPDQRATNGTMLDVAYKLMSADEFLAWAQERAEGDRYELDDGAPVCMASERGRHALALRLDPPGIVLDDPFGPA